MRLFLLTSIFFLGYTGILSGQSDVPVNQSYSSDTEFKLLKEAYLNGVSDAFNMHAAVNSSLDISAIEAKKNELTDFILKQTSRYDRLDHEKLMIRNVFYKVHQKYLRQYSNYANLGDLLENGEYDCLSGTILYAWILDQLGFSSRIVETAHHIYLMVETGNGPVMLESTDALNGFIEKPEEIEERLMKVNAEENGIFREEVDFHGLIGLQYYNAAVESYNNMLFIEAVDQLEKASVFYKGDRMKTFGKILARAIVQSEISQELKTAYLFKLNSILSGPQIIASLN